MLLLDLEEAYKSPMEPLGIDMVFRVSQSFQIENGTDNFKCRKNITKDDQVINQALSLVKRPGALRGPGSWGRPQRGPTFRTAS